MILLLLQEQFCRAAKEGANCIVMRRVTSEFT